MAEMTDSEVSERLGNYRMRRRLKVAAVAAVAAFAAAAIAFAALRASAARDAELAEKARVESILNKPLLEWSEAERAEFPAEYEGRRQKERASNPALWTRAEKRAEWWRYSKLLVKSKLRR
ncbi:MAG: hypothetical protein IJP66_00050 [Kiritimatiellae bacterium]|nr:hypothetical protein [Kiritimatiellia bacterium]